MLEFNAQQIRMGQRAADKAEALRLLGAALVADGLVAEGYAWRVCRPVKRKAPPTSARASPFPMGPRKPASWSAAPACACCTSPRGWPGAMARPCTWPSASRPSPTNTCASCNCSPAPWARPTWARPCAQRKNPRTCCSCCKVARLSRCCSTRNWSALARTPRTSTNWRWLGARRLKKAGCVEPGFAAVLQHDQEALPLGAGLWWQDSEQCVTRPGLVFVTPARELSHAGQLVPGLFCLARLGDAHQALLERLCDLLLEGRAGELARATSIRTCGAGSPGRRAAGGLAQHPRAVLANPHGLHARPAQALMQLARNYSGEIRVRLAEGDSAPVSIREEPEQAAHPRRAARPGAGVLRRAGDRRGRTASRSRGR